MQYVKLRNGVEMPLLGLNASFIPEGKMVEVIGKAYETGYRLFDVFGSEQLIARALRENGIRRENVFIITKVNSQKLYWGGYSHESHHYLNIRNFKTIRGVIHESFENLGMDYVDLFLIHESCPIVTKIWLELSRLYCEGRIGAIGVSNFLQPDLEILSEFSDIKPAVNQFDISPLNTQKELIDYCRQRGIVVSHSGVEESSEEFMESSLLKDIASRHKKSVKQIVLRWMLQQNIVMISKTWEHLEESISIFDFELSDEEMKEIGSIRS